MSDQEFKDSRRVFYLKTDGPPGPRHSVARANRLVYRRSMLGDWAGLEQEADLSYLLVSCEVPVVDTSLAAYGFHDMQLIMDVAPGTCVADLPRTERLASYASLVAVLRKLHQIPAKGAGYLVDTQPPTGVFPHWGDYLLTRLFDHCRYAQQHGLMTEEQVIATVRQLHEFTSKPQPRDMALLHGDLNDRNLFAQDGQITAIIDWEDALAGDPLFDLAFWATFHPEDEWPYLFAHYQSEDPRYSRAFWVYYLRIALSKLVLLHRQGYRDLARAKGRITLALERVATFL